MNLNDYAAIIPCYRAKKEIDGVISRLLNDGFVNIIVVDDCCPEGSIESISNQKIITIRTPENVGVGGAFFYGLEFINNNEEFNNIRYIAKIDADGQHSSQDLKRMCIAINESNVDYIKGNRYLLGRIPVGQPFVRKIGNIGLTFLNKISTGYWDIGDPVNGLIVFNRKYINYLRKFPISNRYLFESSLLYFSGLINAKIIDFPNQIVYLDENSSLNIRKEFTKFLIFHIRGAYRRIVYEYLYPNFDLAILGFFGAFALPIGLILAMIDWILGNLKGRPSETGEIAIDLVLIILGFISLIFFLQRDQSKKKSDIPVNTYL